MRALGRVLGYLVLALAWLTLLLGVALVVLETSGVLGRALRTTLAWRLGPLGDGLEIGSVELRWFEPGVEIRDVRLVAPHPDGQDEELLLLERVHFSIDPNLEERPLRQLHVDGGRVRISSPLLEGLDRFARSWQERTGDADLSPPPFVLTNFDIEIDLELEGGDSVLEIGTVDLLARPREAGGVELRGELRPTFSGAVRGSGSIQVFGDQQPDGRLEVRAVANALPLESSDFAFPPALGPLPVAAFAGELSLTATGTLDLRDTFAATGALRAQLVDARLQPRPGDPWLEELALDVDSKVELEGAGDLWGRDQWDTVLRTRAMWRDETDTAIATPVEVWGLFGKRVPQGAWARSFLRAERLPLSENALRALGATDGMRDLWSALEAMVPEGVVDATLDTILERRRADDGTFRYPVRSAAHVRAAGEAALTFRGYPAQGPEARPGDRLGIGVRCGDLTGDVALTFDPSRARSWWLALSDLEARHSAGPVAGWGVLSARADPDHHDGPHLDVELRLEPFTLDEPWQEALAESFLTRRIWADYDPRAGRLGGTWRFRDAPGTNGLTASGDLTVADAQLAWAPLPIPIDAVEGRLALRWAGEATPLVYGDQPRQPGQPRALRPFGVAWELANPTSAGLRVAVRGMLREEPVPAPLPAAEFRVDRSFWALDVAIEELGLRGSDSDRLAAFAEEFGRLREDLQAVGKMQLTYASGRPRADLSYEAYVEARPLVARVTPKLFPRQATDLSGRVLVHMEYRDPDLEQGTTDARASMVGRWPRDVSVAADLDLAPDGQTLMRVLAAGPNPDDPALRGAFEAAFAESQGGASVDLSETSLRGALDFELSSAFLLDAPPEETRNTFRLFLRDCTLENESILLEDLHGALVAQDDVLRGPLVNASLAGHPVLLRDVLVFPLERAAEVDGVDPLLLRSGFLSGRRGTATQAIVEVHDLPLDVEHLASLADEDALAALSESPSWRGQLDVLGARLLVTSPADTEEGVVVLSGPLRPHDISLSFGLPIEVAEADVDLREMVLERGGVRAWARISGLDAVLADRELTDARMILALVDGRLSIDAFDGAFVGGRLQSLGNTGQGSRKALGVDMTPPHRFDVAVSMQEVEVERLLKGVFQSSIADAGRLRANLQLSGTPEDVLGLTGRGQLWLTEGRLWSIPAMRALFTQLGFPNTAVFDYLDSRFEIRRGVIDTHHVLVKSALLKLFGSGTLDLDGGLSFDLDVRYSIVDRLGILNRLIYWLNRNLIRVAVRGDFVRPEVRVRSSLLELLSGAPPELERGLPLPEFAPLGPRF